MFSRLIRSSIGMIRVGLPIQGVRAFPNSFSPSSFPNSQIVRHMANHRHKKLLKQAKGYRGRAKSCYTVALQRVTKAKQNMYRDRKVLYSFYLCSFHLLSPNSFLFNTSLPYTSGHIRSKGENSGNYGFKELMLQLECTVLSMVLLSTVCPWQTFPSIARC